MRSILIGSRALRYWNPKLNLKDTTDWDVISNKPVLGTEWHKPDVLNNNELAKAFKTEHSIRLPDDSIGYVMSMLGLAIIKRSHLWVNNKFQSHITQYHKFGLSEYAAAVKNNLYYSERLKLTKQMYENNHPKLNVPKSVFFTDAVTRKYDHDILHVLVAKPNKPIYKQLLVDEELVMCSEQQWNALTFARKVECVSEEVMVTALERFVIPNKKYPLRHAYVMSLDKICTTICSGWFRDFAIDNYPAIIGVFDANRLTKVLKELGER